MCGSGFRNSQLLEKASYPWVGAKIGREQEFLLLAYEFEGSSTRSDEGESWRIYAELSLPGLRASSQAGIVWGVDASLSEHFDDLAQNWRGWKGVKKWEAYEAACGRGELASTRPETGSLRMGVSRSASPGDDDMPARIHDRRGDNPRAAAPRQGVSDLRNLLAVGELPRIVRVANRHER